MKKNLLGLMGFAFLAIAGCTTKDEHSQAEKLLNTCFRMFTEKEDYYFEHEYSSFLDSAHQTLTDSLQSRLKRIEKLYPSSSAGTFAAFWNHSLTMSRLGKYYNSDSMQLVLKRFIQKHPESYHPYLAAAWYALDTASLTNVQPCSEYINKAIEKDPRNAVLFTWASYVEFRRDTTSLNRNSRSLIAKAVDELDSTYYLANAEYFKLLDATEDSIKGGDALKIKILKHCIRLDSRNSFGYYWLAELSKNYYEKMSLLDSAIRLGDKKAFGMKTQMLFNRNQYDEVVKFMNSVKVLDSTMFVKKAYSEYFTGRLTEAEESLRIYSLLGTGTDADYQRAYMEMGVRNYAKAISLARKQLEQDGEGFVGSHHVLLVNLLILTGQRAEAIKHFEEHRERIAENAPQGAAGDYGIGDLLEYSFRK